MGLFSVRWVLQALGSEDFGLYSVVGGLIVFIMVIGNTMSSSVQRFYAYAIGQGDPVEVQRWFNCAFSLHAAFAVILIFLGLTFGNYLISHVMQILWRHENCHWVITLHSWLLPVQFLSYAVFGMFYARQRIFELTFCKVFKLSGYSFLPSTFYAFPGICFSFMHWA